MAMFKAPAFLGTLLPPPKDRGRNGLDMDSSTEGATYVKPRNTWLADSDRTESTGESSGVICVNFESNWDVSSSSRMHGLKGGSRPRRNASSQLT